MKAAAAAGMNTWWYAPKEDAAHRLAWRTPYSSTWRDAFRRFCQSSREHGITITAGMAPGMDFDFSQVTAGYDIHCLAKKTEGLLEDGAEVAALLLDDIDPLFTERSGDFASEGEAHAALANELGQRLGRGLLVVPRIYANELHHECPDYLPTFSKHLDDAHAIVHCGSDVVSREVSLADCRAHTGDSTHRVLVWDNLYANDYCPRRLFVGPWRGRSGIDEFFLNPTGLPATDALLFDLVVAEKARGSADVVSSWRKVLERHGVPVSFNAIADFFDAPVFNTAAVGSQDTVLSIASHTLEDQLEALDELTWRWKSALAREWFPYLMGLRHDLLVEHDRLSTERIHKTQLPPLARWLSESSRTSGS